MIFSVFHFRSQNILIISQPFCELTHQLHHWFSNRDTRNILLKGYDAESENS